MIGPAGGAVAHRSLSMLAVMLPLVVLSQFFRSSIGVIGPNLMIDLRLTPEDLGLLSGSFFFVFAALQVPIGILIDRFGGRRVLPSMMVLAVLGSFLFAMGRDIYWAMAGRALIGIGCAGLMIGSLTILRRWFSPVQFATAMSVLFGCANAGGLIATLPLAAATNAWGWRATFLGLAFLSFALSVAFFLVVRDAPSSHEKGRGRSKGHGTESLAEVAAGVRDIVVNRDLLFLMPLIAVGYASSIAILGLWGGPYLYDVYGLDEVERGNLLSVMAVMMIVGTFAYGPLDRRYNTRRGIVTAGALATLVPLTLLCLFPETSPMIAAMLLAMFGFLSSYSLVVMAHGLALVPDRLAGRGAAVLNTALMGGAGLMQSLTGLLMEWTQHGARSDLMRSYSVLFAALALVIAGALLIYRWAVDVRPRDPGFART
jgi:MFS family permease